METSNYLINQKAKEFDEWIRRAHKTFRTPVYDLSLGRE